jgi:hypothetical protein
MKLVHQLFHSLLRPVMTKSESLATPTAYIAYGNECSGVIRVRPSQRTWNADIILNNQHSLFPLWEAEQTSQDL